MKEKFGVIELWNVTLVNTTPHPIKIMLGDKVIEIPAATEPLRLREETNFIGIAGDIPLFSKRFFLEDMLPPEDENGEVLFIVPAIVAQTLGRKRRDLVVPHDFVRDKNGTIIGCCGLAFIE